MDWRSHCPTSWPIPTISPAARTIQTNYSVGWRPFSSIATFSIVALILTGLYSAGDYIATFDALITTFYGQTLLSKVTLTLLMGLFGLFNAAMLHPGLAAPLPGCCVAQTAGPRSLLTT
ncbi:MAG: CopD family protein [Chloroflexi bacterium]|nr:CopD family protein [Chloroflexota bacterium]